MNSCFSYHYYTGCLFLILSGLTGCGQSKIEKERKKTMTEIIYAFSKGDTQKVYTLIDTGFCFSMDSKSSFIRSQQNLHSVLSANPISVTNGVYSILPNSLNNTISYEVAFGIKAAKYDSIKFRFSFNQNVYKIVYYTKIFWHPKDIVQQPIIKAPM